MGLDEFAAAVKKIVDKPPLELDEDDDETIELDGSGRIAVDDFVEVRPSEPGRRDGFVGRCRGWWITDAGVVTAVDVWGAPRKGYEKMRSIRPDRIRVLSARRQSALRKAAQEGT